MRPRFLDITSADNMRAHYQLLALLDGMARIDHYVVMLNADQLARSAMD